MQAEIRATCLKHKRFLTCFKRTETVGTDWRHFDYKYLPKWFRPADNSLFSSGLQSLDGSKNNVLCSIISQRWQHCNKTKSFMSSMHILGLSEHHFAHDQRGGYLVNIEHMKVVKLENDDLERFEANWTRMLFLLTNEMTEEDKIYC